MKPTKRQKMICFKAEKTKSMQWSDLPVELCEEIMGRLYFRDQVRFHAVCKNWHSSQYREGPAALLPWLITLPMISKNICECKLYEPLSSDPNPYAVDEIILYNIVTRSASWRGVGVTYNYGCILFSIPRTDFTSTNFVLFSILSRKVKTLPVLYHQNGYSDKFIKAFSTDPNSPDCVFLVMQFMNIWHHTISTFRYGEQKWTTKEFHLRAFFPVGSVYIRGIFYFVSCLGKIASYNIATGEWSPVFHFEDVLQRVPGRMIKEVFQLDGDLVLICYPYDDDTGFCCIRRFDLGRKKWIAVKSLGDRALFVSPNCFPISTLGEEARNNGLLANQIYCLTSSGCIVYNLENGIMVKCRNGSGIKNWYTNATCKKFWFEPPDRLLKQKETSTNMIKRNWGRKRNRSRLLPQAKTTGNNTINI